ncbi:uncharacterized protein LOC116594149 isoform X1 [Mustela erminea]|uniref:uncharacterized protein LOC116594149 isoform X1 n=1 Tax=Mustela erminea TaxID=36723 RepID=UPI0013868785|nr:uncharacterized protein LOC116594149 isoform X1 [Mustela erminea]
MIQSSEITERNQEWDTSGKNIEDIMEVLQAADQLSTDNVFKTLKLLKVKILNNKMVPPLCQKVTDIFVDYLRTMKPEGELEELCTTVLMALGFQSLGIVIFKLWDRWHNTLPPNCLLTAVGRLIHRQDAASYIGVTWEYILRLLRMAQTEDDMLALCHVLKGLVISARKHVGLSTTDDGHHKRGRVLQGLSHPLASLQLLVHKDQQQGDRASYGDNWSPLLPHAILQTQEPSEPVNPMVYDFGICKSDTFLHFPGDWNGCIYQLIDALALSGCGGINLESQMENITDMLFNQLSETVKESDPHSARNHIIALKAFYILSKLYNDQVVFLIQKTMKTSDPAKIVSALQVFMDVFPEVPQTEQLKNEVMHSIIIMIQDDLKPNEEDIQQMCSEILQMVSLPKLITLACQPSNTLAFVLLSKIATNMALKARSLGQVPYLSSFHLSPTQFISPQKLLTHLVVFALKSYSERELGISSLRLLHALHPITSLHPVINSNVGQLWMKEIPQMLQILDGLFVWTMFCTEQICSPEFCASRFPRTLFLVLRGSAKSVGFGTRDPDHTEKNLDQEEWEDRLLQFSSQSLVAINDDSWLEQLIKVV